MGPDQWLGSRGPSMSPWMKSPSSVAAKTSASPRLRRDIRRMESGAPFCPEAPKPALGTQRESRRSTWPHQDARPPCSSAVSSPEHVRSPNKANPGLRFRGATRPSTWKRADQGPVLVRCRVRSRRPSSASNPAFSDRVRIDHVPDQSELREATSSSGVHLGIDPSRVSVN